MQIISYGNTFVKIITKSPTTGDCVVFFDPFEVKAWGGRQPKMEADIVIHTATTDKKTPHVPKAFVVATAGEYEVNTIAIYGLTGANDDPKKPTNTLYIVQAEDIKVAHLGHIRPSEINAAQKEFLSQADIVLIPVGGGDSLSGVQAANLIQELQPRVAIPMHYKYNGAVTKLDTEQQFLKELGGKTETTNKYTIKYATLPAEDMAIVLLHE